FSAPGTGGSFYQTYGEDGNSLWGDPLFVNSSFTNFDPMLSPSSRALGAGVSGSDIGAKGVSGPDVTPPATVSNLAFSQVFDLSAVLTWAAPGDNGSSGTVTSYDLRYSTSPITAAN